MPVDVSGLKEQLRQANRERLERAGQIFVDNARARIEGKTGAMADSVRAEPVVDLGDVLTMRLVCDAESESGFPYPAVQDQGTGPIQGNPLLVFEGEDGEMVFVRSTSGVPATRFWSDTVEEWPGIVQQAG